MRTALLASAFGLCLASAAPACDMALLLAVDVSGSVDPDEYRIQIDGLAAALRDGSVSEALVRAEAQVSLVQWTGSTRQDTSIPWRQILTPEDAEALAAEIEVATRPWRSFSTAIGEALDHGLIALLQVPECKRKVIDVSGDGPSNEGIAPDVMRADLLRAGITVNALVIDTGEEDLTGYFRNNVIVGADAFVVTANGFEEYPEKIRRKLLREISQKVARADLP